MKRYINKIMAGVAMAAIMAGMSACKDTKSYADLLKEETHAANWFLAGYRIENQVPEDSVFIELKDNPQAPFYKLDNDGYLYMQVVNSGTPDSKPEKGDMVYFRFKRKNIKYMFNGYDVAWEGNAIDMNANIGATYFIYGNSTETNSANFGSGIQFPLNFLNYNSEVNLVLCSYYGFTNDQSQCNPYIINIKYFKSEY